MASQPQQDWVKRVLGFVPHGAGAVDVRAVRAAVRAWREASEAVDAQVSALQAVLKASADPDLQEIADFGMVALSGGNRTRILAAVAELEHADPPPPELLKRTATIVAKCRAHFASDPKVRGFDSNPFGVKVSIRATLTPVLQQIEAAVTPRGT
jgi:hypothetical protein